MLLALDNSGPQLPVSCLWVDVHRGILQLRCARVRPVDSDAVPNTFPQRRIRLVILLHVQIFLLCELRVPSEPRPQRRTLRGPSEASLWSSRNLLRSETSRAFRRPRRVLIKSSCRSRSSLLPVAFELRRTLVGRSGCVAAMVRCQFSIWLARKLWALSQSKLQRTRRESIKNVLSEQQRTRKHR